MKTNKLTCPNCKSSKLKHTHNQPLNYNCKDCNMVFYDSRIEDQPKIYVAEFIYSIIAILIIAGAFYFVLFVIELIDKLNKNL